MREVLSAYIVKEIVVYERIFLNTKSSPFKYNTKFVKHLNLFVCTFSGINTFLQDILRVLISPS